MPRSLVGVPSWVAVLPLTGGIASGRAPRAPVEEGERTETQVLGTEHLSAQGDSLDTALLDGIMSALERFAPDEVRNGEGAAPGDGDPDGDGQDLGE